MSDHLTRWLQTTIPEPPATTDRARVLLPVLRREIHQRRYRRRRARRIATVLSAAAVFILVLLGPQPDQLGSDNLTLVPTGEMRVGFEMYRDVLTGELYPVDEHASVEFWQRKMARIEAGDILLSHMTHFIYAGEDYYLFGYDEIMADGSHESTSNKSDPPLESTMSKETLVRIYPYLQALIPRIYDPDDGRFLYVKQWYLDGTIVPVEYREYDVEGLGSIIVGDGESIDSPGFGD